MNMSLQTVFRFRLFVENLSIGSSPDPPGEGVPCSCENRHLVVDAVSSRPFGLFVHEEILRMFPSMVGEIPPKSSHF